MFKNSPINRKRTPPILSIKTHSIKTLDEIDQAVHELQLYALERGMIPIVGVISRPLKDGKHEILGFGHNELADGIPGVHGETGAIKNMGRITNGYTDLVVTSSLSPCPFCQCTLAKQLGIKSIRILDDKNYLPDKTDYEKAGITPEINSHIDIEKIFKTWVENSRNKILWNRDIGIPTGKTRLPYQFTEDELIKLINRAERIALEGMSLGEAPIGALIVDNIGQVVSSSYPRIIIDNDPSNVAAMAAWRAAGSRDDWGSHTLILTNGPDHIAYSMFKVFNFGQLIVGSDSLYQGQLTQISKLGKEVTVLNQSHLCDTPLQGWINQNNDLLVKEYLGSDWNRS